MELLPKKKKKVRLQINQNKHVTAACLSETRLEWDQDTIKPQMV